MSGSLHSLTKSLVAIFSDRSHGQEAEIDKLVSAYIDKHTPPSDNDRKRLQAELLEIHRQYVKAENSGTFLHVLTLLRHDFIIEAEECAMWWSLLLSPILNHRELLKSTLKDSRTICLDVMVPSDDDEHFKVRYAAAERFKAAIYESYFDAVDTNRINVAENLQSLLIVFARRQTKEYFESIDPFLRDPHRRLQTLTLISSFTRLQTQYIYQIAETPLLNSLLSSLEHDTSTTVVSLGLTILIMIVPHIPTRISDMLPRLFRVFGRVLCWDRLGAVQRRTTALVEVEKTNWEESDGPLSPRPNEEYDDDNWKRLDASFDNLSSTPPNCSQYFTFLYGLYPVNFLHYLRAASEYIPGSASATADGEKDGIDDEIIRVRAEPFVRRHLVHPNLTIFTPETEKTDLSRWMKLEPADVVTLCISLDTVNTDHGLQPVYSPTVDQDVTKFSLDDGIHADGNNEGQGTRAQTALLSQLYESGLKQTNMIDSQLSNAPDDAGSRLASPAFLPKVVSHELRSIQPMSRTSSISRRSVVAPDDMIKLHEELLSREVTPSRDTDSLTSPGSGLDSDSKANLSFYHRELLLLKNELRFERHLRQQHLQHIGRLQRDRISDAALESERQNLYNTTRALKSQVSTLQVTLKKLRAEATTSKANRAQYEASLNERIKKLREEKNKLLADQTTLQDTVDTAQKDVANMQVALGVAEGQALNLKQQLQVLQPEIQEAKELRNNLDLLKNRIREAEVQDLQLRMEKERVIEAQAQVRSTMLKYEALQAEFEAHVRESTKAPSTEQDDRRSVSDVRQQDSQKFLIQKLREKATESAEQVNNMRLRQAALSQENLSQKNKILELQASIEGHQAAAAFRESLQEKTTPTPDLGSSSMRTSSIRDMPSPSVGAMAANSKLYEDEENVHGVRRQQPLGLINKDAALSRTGRSMSSNTIETTRVTDKPPRSSTSSPSAKIVKENKDRVSLGGRFRW